MLGIAQSASSVADLLTQLSQVAGETGFERIGEVAATQPIRTALQSSAEIVFVHAIDRATQLGRSGWLCRCELTRRRTHLLSEMRQVVGHLLAIVYHFVDFLGRWIVRRLAGGASGSDLSDQVAHMIRLLLLPIRQLIRGLGHRTEA